MAGRGRGRGRGALAVAAETLGIGRGDLPPPTLEPPPLFPPLEFKPVPLLMGEEYDYMLALKQEFRGTIRESPYFIKPANRRNDIDRYSDKYQTNGVQDNTIGFCPDWRMMPQELKIRSQRPVKSRAGNKPNLSARGSKQSKTISDEVIKKKLENLEQKESTKESGGGDKVGEEEEEEEDQEVEEDYYDEEDLEEGTDYNMTYFDNGEDFGLDEDDNLDDGPVY